MAAFAHLVRMLGRAFYTDVPGDERKALAPHALVPVVLDAMTRREWVKEDNLAGELGLHPKQIRKVLRFLHEEQLICREFRKERGVADGDAPAKSFTHSYSCLDYSRCVDVARYRLHFMVKDIKVKLDEKDKVSTYRCKRCGAAYTSFDIMGMVIDPEDFSFHCERCGGALEDEEGDDEKRRLYKRDLRLLKDKIEQQVQPLAAQLQKVKDDEPPDYGTLQDWYRAVLKAEQAGQAGGEAPGAADLAVDLGEKGEAAPAAPAKALPAFLVGSSVQAQAAGPAAAERAPGPAGAAAAQPQPQPQQQANYEAFVNAYLKRQQQGGTEPPAKKARAEAETPAPPAADAADAADEGDEDVEWED